MVVFDSVHGNTEQVARAIAGGLGSPEEIATRRVTEVHPEELAELDILVVGAPTHAFQPSPKAKEFLNSIPAGTLKGVKVAAFDTRMSVGDAGSAMFSFFVKFFGYAAKPIARRLERKGADLVVAPEGFFVKGAEGPLHEGELERAAEWGRRLSARR
jgi:flavodoxin